MMAKTVFSYAYMPASSASACMMAGGHAIIGFMMEVEIIDRGRQTAIAESVRRLSSGIPIHENVIINGNGVPSRTLNEYMMSTCCALAAIGCVVESMRMARMIDSTGLSSGVSADALPNGFREYVSTVIGHIIGGMSPFDVIVVDEMRLFVMGNENLLSAFDKEYANAFGRLLETERKGQA